MASAPQSLPLFYNGLEPLSSQAHADFRVRPATKAPFLVGQHAIPLTVDEFVLAQRFMPIVFSVGDDAIPLALMGLNEGVNVFVDDDGALINDQMYVPAYVRRYPYMLARLRPDSEDLSLCFDPSSDTIGAFEDGEALFANGEPTEFTKSILDFNRMFEEAGQRTAQFMREVNELGLLMDGEFSIQPQGSETPFIYRGFQMINEQKFNDLRGDQLRKIAQSGLLPLLYAHLFSLSVIREVFERQAQRGLLPAPELTI
ncbi:SapC family protein [Sphingomonas sp. GlSt437]|uniref:SapC family protein n=1 Tax=Sphingomonas sp. GlSt437 TaxID=3389970 RepID=UPI003A872846